MQETSGIEDDKSVPKASVKCLVHAYTRLQETLPAQRTLIAKLSRVLSNVNCSTAVTSRLNLLRCVYIEQGATTLYRATLGASLLSQSLKVLQKQEIS